MAVIQTVGKSYADTENDFKAAAIASVNTEGCIFLAALRHFYYTAVCLRGAHAVPDGSMSSFRGLSEEVNYHYRKKWQSVSPVLVVFTIG